MSVDQDIKKAAEQLEADVQLTSDITHGDEDSEIPTLGGTVPTLRKRLKDIETEWAKTADPLSEDLAEAVQLTKGYRDDAGDSAKSSNASAQSADNSAQSASEVLPKVIEEGEKQVAAVTSTGNDQLAVINKTSAEQLDAIKQEGSDQITVVTAEGNRQTERARIEGDRAEAEAVNSASSATDSTEFAGKSEAASNLSDQHRQSAETAQAKAKTARAASELAAKESNIQRQASEAAKKQSETARDEAQAAEGMATPAAIKAESAQAAAEKARDDAEVIAYEGDASLEPKPGSIPIANSKAKIQRGWLPEYLIPAPDVSVPIINNLNIREGFADSIDFKRASTDLQFNSSGVFEIKQIDEPCFFRRGLQVYNSATNLFIGSEKELLPYGDDDSITEEISLGDASIVKYIGTSIFRRKTLINLGSTNEIFAYSFFIKPDSTSEVYVSTFNGSTANSTIIEITSFGKMDVTVGSQHELVSSGSERYGEYYRCHVILKSTDGYAVGSTYLNSTDNVEFGLQQVEERIVTTYMSTDNTAVTRATAIPSIPAYLNLPHFTDDMTVAITFNAPDYADNWMSIFSTSDAVGIIEFGVTHNFNQSSWTIYNHNNYPERGIARNCLLVIRKKGSEISIFSNGELIRTTTDCVFSGEITGDLMMGIRHNLIRLLNGTISNLNIWHLPLTDGQIEALGVA